MNFNGHAVFVKNRTPQNNFFLWETIISIQSKKIVLIG
jgi:hypothetical protein